MYIACESLWWCNYASWYPHTCHWCGVLIWASCLPVLLYIQTHTHTHTRLLQTFIPSQLKYTHKNTSHECLHTNYQTFCLLSLTFTSCAHTSSVGIEAAVKALELVNGYIMREKPLIVAFGKAINVNSQTTRPELSWREQTYFLAGWLVLSDCGSSCLSCHWDFLDEAVWVIVSTPLRRHN